MNWNRSSQLLRIRKFNWEYFAPDSFFFFACKLYNESTIIILRIRHGKFCSSVNEAVASMKVDYKSQIHSR